MPIESVSVIIAASGNKEYLAALLSSLRRQSRKPDEVIVIDNSLQADFGASIAALFPGAAVYTAGEALSYCQAVNKGIETAGGDFILCLNDDVILDDIFIEEAVKVFQTDPGIGMVSGKILRFNRHTIDSTGLFLSIFRTARERGYGVKDRGQFEREGYIFGVTGAVAFYRRAMLDQVKVAGEYFDTNFRFFYEDLDLAWRAQKLGWKGYYIPRAVAFHLRGGTARQKQGINRKFARMYLSEGLHFDLVKNRYLTLIKNEDLLIFIALSPFILFYDIAAWCFILFFRPKVLCLFFQHGVPLCSAFRKRHLLKEISVSHA